MVEKLKVDTRTEILIVQDQQEVIMQGLAGRGQLAATDPDEERGLKVRLKASRVVEGKLREKLIQHTNAVNVANEQGRTPLWAAVASRRQAVVERLLQGFAEIDLADHRGFTPLIQAW